MWIIKVMFFLWTAKMCKKKCVSYDFKTAVAWLAASGGGYCICSPALSDFIVFSLDRVSWHVIVGSLWRFKLRPGRLQVNWKFVDRFLLKTNSKLKTAKLLGQAGRIKMKIYPISSSSRSDDVRISIWRLWQSRLAPIFHFFKNNGLLRRWASTTRGFIIILEKLNINIESNLLLLSLFSLHCLIRMIQQHLVSTCTGISHYCTMLPTLLTKLR